MSSAPLSNSDYGSSATPSISTQFAELQARNTALERQVEQLTHALAASEARRQASETWLNGILNSAIAAITSFRVYVDREWEYEYRSAGCEAVFGYTAEEFLADPNLWTSQVLAEDFATVVSPAIAQIFTKQSFQVEYRFHDKQGNLRWIKETLTSRRDEAANCWIVTTVAIDITQQQAILAEREQFAAALQESEQQWRSILDSSPYAIFLKDEQGRYTYVNRAYEQLAQCSAAQLLGISDYELLPADFAKRCQISDETALASDRPLVFEEQVPFAHGTRTLLITKFALRDVAGQPYGVCGITIDISDRKQLELALQASEAKLNDILDSAAAVISSVRVDADGSRNYEYMSLGCEAVFGYTRHEFLTEHNVWRSHVFPEDLQRILLVEQIDRETTDIVPYRFQRKDGSWRWLSNHVKARWDEATHTWLATIIDIDIHDRKTAEIALEQSESQYRLLFENNPNPLWIFDPTTLAFLAVNDAAVQHYGYSRAEFLSMTIADIRPEKDIPNLKWAIATFTTTPPEQRPLIYQGEWRHRKRDGTVIDVEINTHEIVWQGQPACFVMATDITNRKQLERALKTSEAKLTDILNNAGAAITRFRLFPNLHVQYEFYSQSSEAIFGYSVEELMNETGLWMSCVDPDDLKQVHLPAFDHLYAERSATIEFRFRQKDGSWRWISETATSKRDEEKDCWIVTCVATDISDRKQLELSLQASEAKLTDILNSATAAIASLRVYETGDYDYEHLSSGCESVFGYTRDEFLNDKNLWRSRVFPDDLGCVLLPEQIKQESTGIMPYRFYHKDGSLRWLSNHITVKRDETTQTWLVTVIDIDISDRKQAEEALRQSEERFQEIAQTISQLFFVRSAITGEYSYISPAYERIWGRSCESLYQNSGSWLEAIHPDDRPQILRSLKHQFRGNSVQREYRIIRPDGDIRWIYTQINLVRDEAGNPLRFIGSAVDISDRKQAEEALRQSEEQLRQIIDNIPDVFFLKDIKTGSLIYLNSAYETLYHKPCQSLYDDPNSWTDSIHPDDLGPILSKYGQELRGDDFFDDEYRLVRPDGSIRWVWDRTFPIRNEQGEIYRYAGVNRDITVRKELELALQASETKLNNILNNVIAAIASFRVFENYDWEYSYWSEGCQALFGYTAQELMADKLLWISRIHPDDRDIIITPGYKDIFAERAFSLEFRFYHKDGSLRWIAANCISQRDEVNNCWLVTEVSIDISDRKQAEAELQASEARFQTLVTNMPGMIYRYFPGEDGAGAFTYVSSGCYELLELEPDQILQDANSVWRLIHPEDFPSFQASVAIAVQNNDFWHWEGRFTTPSGEAKWIQGNSRPQRTPDGVVWDGILIDVTDRKQAEIALRESREELQLITNSLPACIAYIDAEQQYRFVNKTYEQWFGTSKAELLGKTVREVIGEAAYDLTRGHVEQALAGGWVQYEAELPYPNQRRYVSATLIPDTEDETLNVRGYYALITDISDRKQVEDALRQSETRLRAIFENAGIGIAVCPFHPQTGEPYLENTNLAFQTILGYSQEELKHFNFRDITYAEDLPKELCLIAECEAGATGYSLEKRYIHKDGSLIWAKLTVSLVRDLTGMPEFAIALVEDIRDRKQFEQQLQLSLREKETLLTEIHHRVKNNLQVISSLLDLQANRTTDPQLQAALHVSRNRILSMALVHEALYSFEQFAEISFATYAERLISHLINTYNPLDQPVTLHLNIDGAIAIPLDQAVPCGLILNELVTNVMKYGVAHVAQKQLYVSLESLKTQELRLTVGNPGDTLPPDFSISKDISIGLTLVLVLTEQLEGRFEVERGDRTLFIVTFPRA